MAKTATRLADLTDEQIIAEMTRPDLTPLRLGDLLVEQRWREMVRS